MANRVMALDLPTLTAALQAGGDLTSVEAGGAAVAMTGTSASDEAKEAFLLALARKGETAVEVAAFAHAYRDRARQVDLGAAPATAIDIVGTGGDRSGSFNISSVSSLIVAAAGVTVLKHGNRSITSKSGSADFLAGLGVELEATDDQLRRAVRDAGFCYLYAPAFHPAFKAILGVRRKLAAQGDKTIFNVLGPLINPARPACMMVGVYDERWVVPMAAWTSSRPRARTACAVAASSPASTASGCPATSVSGPVRSRTCAAARPRRTSRCSRTCWWAACPKACWTRFA
ncbi:MAG: hypothetical protein RL250_1798 [Verrucomicrobiota bacterium]